MKIDCHCGAIIADAADNLPHKAHLIPDQEWFRVFEAIDGVIEDLAAGRADAESAQMGVRRILGEAARQLYQCRNCGRLYVDDQQHQLHTFTPDAADGAAEVLRGRPK